MIASVDAWVLFLVGEKEQLRLLCSERQIRQCYVYNQLRVASAYIPLKERDTKTKQKKSTDLQLFLLFYCFIPLIYYILDIFHR